MIGRAKYWSLHLPFIACILVGLYLEAYGYPFLVSAEYVSEVDSSVSVDKFQLNQLRTLTVWSLGVGWSLLVTLLGARSFSGLLLARTPRSLFRLWLLANSVGVLFYSARWHLSFDVLARMPGHPLAQSHIFMPRLDTLYWVLFNFLLLPLALPYRGRVPLGVSEVAERPWTLLGNLLFLLAAMSPLRWFFASLGSGDFLVALVMPWYFYVLACLRASWVHRRLRSPRRRAAAPSTAYR